MEPHPAAVSTSYTAEDILADHPVYKDQSTYYTAEDDMLANQQPTYKGQCTDVRRQVHRTPTTPKDPAAAAAAAAAADPPPTPPIPIATNVVHLGDTEDNNRENNNNNNDSSRNNNSSIAQFLQSPRARYYLLWIFLITVVIGAVIGAVSAIVVSKAAQDSSSSTPILPQNYPTTEPTNNPTFYPTSTANPTVCTRKGRIVSDFEQDRDGWDVGGDGEGPSWQQVGGNPGGHIIGIDQARGSGWFFKSHPNGKFSGDLTDAIGGSLHYDFKTSHVTTDGPPVTVSGWGGLAIEYDYPFPKEDGWARDWVTVSIPFSAEIAWKLQGEDTLATMSYIQAVLSNVEEIRIPSEYSDALDTGSLDNVVIEFGSSCDERGLAEYTYDIDLENINDEENGFYEDRSRTALNDNRIVQSDNWFARGEIVAWWRKFGRVEDGLVVVGSVDLTLVQPSVLVGIQIHFGVSNRSNLMGPTAIKVEMNNQTFQMYTEETSTGYYRKFLDLTTTTLTNLTTVSTFTLYVLGLPSPNANPNGGTETDGSNYKYGISEIQLHFYKPYLRD